MRRQPKKEGEWATVRVRPETRRLLRLIVAVEGTPVADLLHEMAAERWAHVLAAGILPDAGAAPGRAAADE
jgi:hypothetical protein